MIKIASQIKQSHAISGVFYGFAFTFIMSVLSIEQLLNFSVTLISE